MDLADITPVVLTFNEAPNLERSLGQLRWARRVVVLDSGSTDATQAIARTFDNVDLREHAFDTHAAQWSRAVFQTEIQTQWVLALDADYFVTDRFVAELRALEPPPDVDGYSCRFVYCVDGRPLRASLYPPVTALFRRERARYVQDGHTQRIAVEGRVETIHAPLLHDDRKPFQSWLSSQKRYAKLEADKLARTQLRELSWPDRVRRVPFAAAPLVFLHCMLAKRCALDGRAGAIYTAQRVIAETMISLAVLERGASRRHEP